MSIDGLPSSTAPARYERLWLAAFPLVPILLLTSCAPIIPFPPQLVTLASPPPVGTSGPPYTPNPDCPLNQPSDPSWFCRKASPTPSQTPRPTSLVIHAELDFDGIGLQGAWSPDSKRLVLAVLGRDLGEEATYLYDIDPFRRAWKMDYPASFVAFDPAGQHILTVNQGLRILDLAFGSVTSSIQFQEGNTLLFAVYLPDGSGLILGKTRMLGQDTPGRTEFSLWEFEHESLSVRSELVGDLTALTVSPDGTQVAASLARLPEPIDTRRSFTWRLPAWDFLCDLPGEQVRYGSRGNFVSSTSRASIDLFDASTCTLLETIYVGEPVTAFAFHPETPVLVVAGSAGGVIWAYDLQTRKRIGQQEVNDVGVITGLSFSPDGHFLLALSANRASVWTVLR